MLLAIASVALPTRGNAQGDAPTKQASAPKPTSTPAPSSSDWLASELRIRYDVERWGPDCGPRPIAHSEPGGPVRIATRGKELDFRGAIRGQTDGCWSQTRGLRRVSHSSEPSRWVTVCRTPKSHAHPEEGHYTLTGNTSERLAFAELTKYDWRLNESRCIATRRANRTITRSGTAKPKETTRAAESCVPGAPTVLRLARTEAEIEPGEKVCLRPRVFDANRCRISKAPLSLSVKHPPSLKGELEGTCFRAGKTAADSEGEFEVTVKSGALEARATITVRSLDLSGITAQRHRARRLQQNPSADAESHGASGIVAKTIGARGFRTRALASAAGLFALGFAFVFLLRRRTRNTALAGAARAHSGSGSTRPQPGFAPLEGSSSSDETRAPRICPVCRRSYPSDAEYCPHDGAELVEYHSFMATAASSKSAEHKLCPMCGRTFDSSVAFCPHDGSTLVTKS